jgi:hypothetical protein
MTTEGHYEEFGIYAPNSKKSMSENTTKKTRALPRVWKQIKHLQHGDLFYLGKILVAKTSFFTAREFEFDSCLGRPSLTGDGHFVWPWRRVKTTQLVRDAKPGGKSSQDLTMSRATENSLEAARLHEARKDDCGVIEIKSVQPNSDNNVTGPTS